MIWILHLLDIARSCNSQRSLRLTSVSVQALWCSVRSSYFMVPSCRSCTTLICFIEMKMTEKPRNFYFCFWTHAIVVGEISCNVLSVVAYFYMQHLAIFFILQQQNYNCNYIICKPFNNTGHLNNPKPMI